jgi:uncharacterized membrane protein
MGSRSGFDRLVFFTDAVTAIAITLLILPLVDLVPAYAARGSEANVATFLRENLPQLGSFVLSFVIIARLWLANHRALENVERQSRRLMVLDLAWSFTVVLIPLPTALTAALNSDPTSIAFYIGTMTASSFLLTAICWEVYRRPELGESDRLRSLTNLVGTGSNTVAFVIALLLGVLLPAVNYWGLLLLLLTILTDAIVMPRLRASAASGNAPDTPRG